MVMTAQGAKRGAQSAFLSIILIGITAVAGQIILIRELFTAFYGNELSVGFVLAVWLFGGAVGSGIAGRRYADRINGRIFSFGCTQIALGILLPACILFVRVSRFLFGISAGEIVSLGSFMTCASIALLPVSALLGFLFVLGCKILPGGQSPAGIGRVYTLEAIGAMIGGTVTSLVLVRFVGILGIAALLGLFNFFSAFVLLKKGSVLKKVSLAFFFAFLVAWVLGGVGYLNGLSLDLKWSGFRLLASRDSVYGRVTVTKREGQFNFFDNGLFLFSSNDPLTAEETVHLPFAFSANPRRVLLVGGGAGEIGEEVLKYNVERVDYVELDPLIVTYAEEFLKGEPFYGLNDPRLNVINEDGRFFIANTADRYDVVLVNLPNPYTARINRFYTSEFFKLVKKILNKNAIFSFSVTSSENYLSSEQALFLKTLLETARAEFAEVKIIPGETAFFIISDRKGLISLNPSLIASGLKRRGIKTFYVRDYYLDSKLSSERLSYLEDALDAEGPVRLNLDFRPISYFYDFVLWTTYFTFKLSKIFMFFTEARLLAAALFFFLLLFLLFYFGRKLRNFRKNAALLALSTTGFSEISFQILIVLGFQIIYGYLYFQIGIIVTSFMFGLWLGSLYMTRRLSRISAPYRLYTRVQFLVFLYPFILILAFRALPGLSHSSGLYRLGANIFAVLPFIAGFVGGLQYPLANKICFEKESRTGETSGKTYAADLFGSFVGALIVSSLFVPVVGIPVTCLLVALLNLVSFFLLLIAQKTRLSA